MKQCYYELLGVSSVASDDELKRAYRKKALQYHPDKNREDTEKATEIFATIRSAYEVLSDPQERAWYDSHREQILKDDYNPNYADDDDYEVDATVTGITTAELLKYFNSGLYTKVNDGPNGLYQIAGKLFAKLASEEVIWGRKSGLEEYKDKNDDRFEEQITSLGYTKACDAYSSNNDTYYPVFGYSTTSYEKLRAFYSKWGSFNSLKSFSWEDDYMYSRNYDRKTKREINKRNEKKRAQARSEYNKTVKRFVTFIKKFDTRMKEGQKKFEAEKKKKLQEALKKQVEKDRQAYDAAISDPFQLQSWQTVDKAYWEELEKQFASSDEEDAESNSDEEVITHPRKCITCNKKFKSQRQFENHNNTNAHKKKLKKVKWQMRKESMHLGLEDISDLSEYDSAKEEHNSSSASEHEDDSDSDSDSSSFSEDSEQNAESLEMDDILKELDKIEKELRLVDELSSSDDNSSQFCVEDGVLSELDMQLASDTEKIASDVAEDPKVPDGSQKEHELDKILSEVRGNEEWDAKTPTKKANKKRKDKKPSKTSSAQSSNIKSDSHIQGPSCGSCGLVFNSRNKLFAHIKSSGHAVAPAKAKKVNPKKKKSKNM
ncbi:HBR544Wp [Eremothecium sinecaudum]|uniref:HBR544Wp n=1 Tax=Eremothecium sinecaudum TaxID=45286 RepID=A0A109UXR8_9SACH|nr:HBR544Wp [Eremothecium sinecaudum]AMD19445.1 HBR544Wp [Eremothecium sinecaudum]